MQERVVTIIELMRQATRGMVEPASNRIVATYGRDPFLILISCILSLRTKDTVTYPASVRLFQQAKTPEQLLKLPLFQVEKLIYPAGFYKNKAKTLHYISKALLEEWAGQVPATYDELITLPGVGPKTANLVLGMAFGVPALCVDTHVHRISNRLGLVKTNTPEETEAALKKVVPAEYWIEYSKLMVMWGQNVCVPISPRCSTCVLAPLCPK